MGLSSSLNAGVMGLAVNATKLATISDNIANSETYGYKRADADFTNMVLEQSDSAYTAGGVQVATFKDVAAQGALISTNNSTDISVAGRGMLPVTNATGISSQTNASDIPLFFSTTGSFQQDEAGYLRTISGSYLMGIPADTNGTIPTFSRNSSVDLEPIKIDAALTPSPSTEVNLGLNLPASATQAGSDGASYDLPIEYYDNLGEAQSLNLTFTPTVPGSGSSNAWSITVQDMAPATPTTLATLDVAFNTGSANAGTIDEITNVTVGSYDASTGILSVTTASGPLEINLGAEDVPGPLTQLASSFSPVGVRANGAPIGNLSSVEVSEAGMIEAIYDNGFRRTIYQVPLVDVPNINGLTAYDNQTFGISNSSGDFFLWDANTGPVGATVGFALTESTTDIAEELTDLIQTQRAYSSNAKIIQTVDEMLQETTNLIR